MIERRVCPSMHAGSNPPSGARSDGLLHVPLPSGPRCLMDATARSKPSAETRGGRPTAPTIPHIRARELRPHGRWPSTAPTSRKRRDEAGSPSDPPIRRAERKAAPSRRSSRGSGPRLRHRRWFRACSSVRHVSLLRPAGPSAAQCGAFHPPRRAEGNGAPCPSTWPHCPISGAR